MAEHKDEYPRSLDIALAASDATQRSQARAALGFETARAHVRDAEARRLAAKHENHEVDAAAKAAIADQAVRVAAASLAAKRAEIQRVTVDDRHGAVHGLVVTPKPAELDVFALADGDKVIAKARTNKRGYFKLEVAIDAANPDVRGRLPIVEGAATTPRAKIRIVVRQGDNELARDPNAFFLSQGRVVYREIVLAEDDD